MIKLKNLLKEVSVGDAYISSDGEHIELVFDKFMSGKYLVTAIQHVITQGKHGDFQYKMRIEATKDGIDGNIPNRSLVVGRDILR